MIKDIIDIECVQRRATKFILNDYDTNYKPIAVMYLFEIQDILFATVSLKFPTKNFNIRHYISFSQATLDLSQVINSNIYCTLITPIGIFIFIGYLAYAC